MSKPDCEWKCSDDDYDCNRWDTGCGNAFSLNEGGPTENKMAYCCYCGWPITEVKNDK